MNHPVFFSDIPFKEVGEEESPVRFTNSLIVLEDKKITFSFFERSRGGNFPSIPRVLVECGATESHLEICGYDVSDLTTISSKSPSKSPRGARGAIHSLSSKPPSPSSPKSFRYLPRREHSEGTSAKRKSDSFKKINFQNNLDDDNFGHDKDSEAWKAHNFAHSFSISSLGSPRGLKKKKRRSDPVRPQRIQRSMDSTDSAYYKARKKTSNSEKIEKTLRTVRDGHWGHYKSRQEIVERVDDPFIKFLSGVVDECVASKVQLHWIVQSGMIDVVMLVMVSLLSSSSSLSYSF